MKGVSACRNIIQRYCGLNRLYAQSKFGCHCQVIASFVACYAFALCKDIACLQAFGHLRTGKDDINTSCWCCCRASEAQCLGMDTPVTIYITSFAQETDAAARRVEGCGRVEKCREKLIARY